MNLDFDVDPLFSWYVVLLAFSGIALLVIGAINVGGLKVGWRALNVLVGLGFTGYAYYLAFVFEGGTYAIFFKAFILPVLLIINAVKAAVTRSQAPAAPAAPPFQPNAQYPPQGGQYPQPNAQYPPQGGQYPPQGAPYQQPSPYQAAAPTAPAAPAAPYQPPAPPQG
ncbi:hypothetical protein [Kitasatospora purpeofusca]|uniref:hypothetical protein n=1 Tax=Kitasatospora purpeofusca TaxID=67352 RepID=UPI00224CB3F9|nr:hypothetical protein [Kitasatospora purpeofusca]MCX4753182.1 hypothetical protein [Kitasatospora purpeofusca]WSR32705.1 hypothetical protein OG715_17965 [Kitasatospora purpeofusca]